MMTLRMRAIKYVSEQRYATLKDLYGGSGSKGCRASFRVPLYQFGLSRFSFPGIPHGVWHIANPKIFEEIQLSFPQEPLYQSTQIHVNEVHHALGMNKIRHVLSDQVNIDAWWSEYRLRAMPVSMREFGYRNIPDAIFWRKLQDGNLQKCFIEYERSAKSQERYKDILKAYVARADVTRGSILFICQNEHIKKELLKAREEVFSKGILNEQEEVFQFIEFERMLNAVER